MQPRHLTAEDIAAGVQRLADAIRERTAGKPLALVGIRSRGDEVAERLLNILAEDDRELAFGVLDISLYRDDFEHLHENPTLQQSEISFPVQGAHIILVDDVLFTGRTIHAALTALADYGRPAKVELAVLIDRGHRELPIQPDYVGIPLDTCRMDHVWVSLQGTDGLDEVRIDEKENPMTPLPQRKKTLEEITKLRESLGIPDLLPPAATTQPAPPVLPAPMPLPAPLAPPMPLPPPVGAAPSTAAPSLPLPDTAAAVTPVPPATDPVTSAVKRVRSLRKADHQPPLTSRPAVPPANSPLPNRRHSADELEQIRRREVSTWQPVPDPRLAAAHPVVLAAGYLTALAGAAPLVYQPVPIAVPIGCVVSSLLVAAFILRSRPLSLHHAGFMAAICLLVVVFGALHYFPQLRHAT